MLFMVIERFKNRDLTAVSERFRRHGRLIPEKSGIIYVASWMSADGASCYQFMQAPTRESLDPWIAKWSDLVDFEVTPVVPSEEFWASRRG
ncbi:MAG: DUF3303 family protein [Planctomycetes bacterium]|nr:DUF3303 family protein [Planctomycetota bacterium]